MAKILIVFAHPERKASFSRAMLDVSMSELSAAGHEVVLSDLYGMGFNPVASDGDFKQRRFPNALQYDREQKFSSENETFALDIQNEIDKLVACDMLILQFPLWWFSVPAILKGWIDRVFVNGTVYGKGRRFDAGGMKGKRAMLSMTTGCLPGMVEPDGLLGGLDIILWHLHHGTLRYAGFEVLKPFAAWSIHYTDEKQRGAYLEAYAQRMRTIATDVPMPSHPMSDFDSEWRLKPGIAPRTAGHRRAVIAKE
ncbi:MAG: NAD(P)H-dependent oxidoreductase [Burkholderiaceae bacterium]|nr:NAD(P)H-dependent oxidoreductase [Burkholderiaceae bacterium]